MAYEWLYGNTESRNSLSASKQALSQELAAQFPSYINSLGLKKADGTALDADNYLDYIKQILIKSTQEAKDAGADIPDSVGFSFSSMAAFQAPLNGQSSKRHRPGMGDKKPQILSFPSPSIWLPNCRTWARTLASSFLGTVLTVATMP